MTLLADQRVLVPERQERVGRTFRGGLRQAVPAALLSAALAGIALVAISYADAGRAADAGFYATFWTGMLVFLVPAAIALLHAGTRRAARCGLVVAIALFTAIPKYLFNPAGPLYFDELAHWRQTQDVIAGGHLFAPNGIVPIVEHFPGLHSVTAGVHLLTGLPVWTCGVIVVALAHVLTLCGIFLLVESLFGDRAGGVAALVYGINPSFLYFDLQFAYESLAIGLVVWTLVGLSHTHAATAPRERWGWAGLTGLLVVACVVTHHLSTLFLGLMLLAVTVAATWPARRTREQAARAAASWAVLLALGGAYAGWLFLVAPHTAGYLSPFLHDGLEQLSTLVSRRDEAADGTGRTLFGGASVPPYERWAALAAPALLLLAAVAGLWCYRRRRERRPMALGLAVVGLLYFGSLPLLLTAEGAQGAHRSWAFTFVGLAVLTAPGVVATLRHVRPRGGLRRALATAVVAMLLLPSAVGGVAAGVIEDYRFPRPYEYGHDVRNLTPEVRALAAWIGAGFGTTRLTTDMYTRGLTDAFAGTDPSAQYRKIPTWELFYPEEPNTAVVAALRHYGYDFLIIDKRLANGRAPDGSSRFYFHAHEPRPDGKTFVVRPEALRKFDRYTWTVKVYDSTNYAVYHLRFRRGRHRCAEEPVMDAPSTWARVRRSPRLAPASLCLAGIVLGWAVDATMLRALFLLPLVFLPGSLLVALVLGPRVRLDPVTRVAVSVVASLVLLMAAGFVLSAPGIGMSRGGFSLVAAVSVAALTVAVALRDPVPDGAGRRRLPSAATVGFAAAMCAMVVAAVVAAQALPRPRPPAYTSLSLAAPWSQMDSMVPVRPGQRLDIPVELRSNAPSAHVSYRITAWLDGEPASRPIETTVPPAGHRRETVTVFAPSYAGSGSVHRLILAGSTRTGWRAELTVYLQGPGG